MSEELLLTSYERGWNEHDPGRCAGCFAEDGVREYRLLRPCGRRGDAPRLVRGRHAVGEDTALAMDALPDLSVEVLSAASSSDRRLWTEWRLRGTHSRDWHRWGADSRRIELLGVSVFRLDNDGFLEERLYWDTALSRARPPGVRGGAG